MSNCVRISSIVAKVVVVEDSKLLRLCIVFNINTTTSGCDERVPTIPPSPVSSRRVQYEQQQVVALIGIDIAANE